MICFRAATSCGTQGEAGKDGATGATGAQGPQGEKGDKGDKGDPVYTVVLLTEGVKTDVISGVSGDKYTLTFTAPAGKEIVSKLTINYENVPLSDEILNGSYTGTFSSTLTNGAVVVSAEFGTVVEYGKGLLSDHYDALAAADKDLAIADGSDEGTDPDVQTGAGSFKDSTLYTVYQTGLGKIAAADNVNKTTTERVQLIRAELAKQIKAVDDAYGILLSAAKLNASDGLKKLYEASTKVGTITTDHLTGREDMTNADRAAILKTSLETVTGATTLNAISKLIKKDTGYTTFEEGKLNLLENNRKTAFNDVNTALTTITNVDNELNATNIKATRATLLTYGIDVLPNDVAEEYIAKISAATELPLNTSELVILGQEGKKAVADNYSNIINALSQSIINSYYKEIDKSTTMDTYLKNVAKGLVSAKVTNWFTTTSASDKTINAILGSSGPINAVEAAFVADYATYSAFNNERKGWVAEEAYTALDEKVAKYLEDKVYKALLDSTTDNGYKEAVANNVKTTLAAQKLLIKANVDDSDSVLADVKTAITVATTAVDTAYITALALYKSTSTGGIQPAAIAADSTEKINIAGTTSGLLSTHHVVYANYVSDISKVYDKTSAELGAQSFDEYKGLVDGLTAKLTALKALDAGYAAWLLTKAADTKYITSGTAVVTDLFYTDNIHEGLETLASEIMLGTKTSTDASAFVTGLGASYEKGVADTLESYSSAIEAKYNALFSAASSGADATVIKNAYLKAISVKGTKTDVKYGVADNETDSATLGTATKYTCDSYTSITSYDTFVRAVIAGAAAGHEVKIQIGTETFTYKLA